MKIVSIILGVLFLLIIAFFMFAPDSRIQAVEAKWNRMIGDNEQICFDHWKQALKDPYSAKVSESWKDGDKRIYLIVKSKNSLGSYVSSEFSCPLRNGEVNEALTKLDVLTKQLGAMQ